MKNLNDILLYINEIITKIESSDEIDDNDIIKLNDAINILNGFLEKIKQIDEKYFDKEIKNNEQNIKEINKKFDNIIRKHKDEIAQLNKDLVSLNNSKKLSNYLR
ncbi:MAG TPA: hypothetical protein PK887_00555 [Ignavibacteriales bacterium]|nr:hypothetical protein [Ignavibacteriales bacterium]